MRYYVAVHSNNKAPYRNELPATETVLVYDGTSHARASEALDSTTKILEITRASARVEYRNGNSMGSYTIVAGVIQ